MSHEKISEQLARKVTPDLYNEVRRLWQIHSIAEDRRDIPGLLSTLTEDCVYELVQNGPAVRDAVKRQTRWVGHEGARQFYTEMLTAFPDIHFDLQNIVIGPQGVFEEARVTATHQGRWLNFPLPSGKQIKFAVLILFPWDSGKKKFTGERVWFYLDGKE